MTENTLTAIYEKYIEAHNQWAEIFWNGSATEISKAKLKANMAYEELEEARISLVLSHISETLTFTAR
jgi:hypothetical protein